MFAGWISFSAESDNEGTLVQAQVLMRANDPLYELGLTFGGHRNEDQFWNETLTALAQLRRPRPCDSDQERLRSRQTPVAPRRQCPAQRHGAHDVPNHGQADERKAERVVTRE